MKVWNRARVFIVLFLMSFFLLACRGDAKEQTKVIHKVNLIDTNKYPIVELMVNKQKFKFILDTGSPYTILSPRTAKKLSLKTHNVSQQQKGLAGFISTSRTINEIQLELSGYICRYTPFVYQEPKTQVKNMYTHIFSGFDGVLGVDFFTGTKLTIDGKNQVAYIEKDIKPTNISCNAQPKYDTKGSLLVVELQGEEFSVLADTGFTQQKSIVFFPSLKTLKLWRAVNAKFVLTRLAMLGNSSMKQTIFPDTIISGQNVGRVMVLIPDPVDTKFKAGNVDGLFGWQYIKNGVLSLDYSTMKPTPATFRFHGKWDRRQNLSGLREGLSITPQGKVVFSKVDIGSPAYLAGIVASDKIVEINGKKVAIERINFLKNALSGRLGDVEITVERDGKHLQKRLKFNDYLLQPSKPATYEKP